MPCPNCGDPMREGLFLCISCAAEVGDQVVIELAEEVEQGSTPQQAFEVVVDDEVR